MPKLTRKSVGNDDQSNVPMESGKTHEEKLHDTAATWHLRLGHILPLTAVQRHIKDDLLLYVKNCTTNCDNCVYARMQRNFKDSVTNTAAKGVLHVDTKGRLEVESVTGDNYFVTIVEARTRHVAVLCSKDETLIASELVKYVRYSERQPGYSITKIHTDR